MQLINATIYLEDAIISRGYVETEDGKICGVGIMSEKDLGASAIDLSGYIIAPGFIDQHVHGAGGADVMDASPKALGTIAGCLVREGVTSFLATTMTMPTKKIHATLQAVAEYRKHQVYENRAEIIGVHLEGPFINPRFKGAQDEKYILEPDQNLFQTFQESAENAIKLVTYAVEADPKDVFLRHLVQQGVVPACGHSGAAYEEVEKCATNGLGCLTHLHNAMSGHHHREPGVVTAGYCLKHLKVELIADGIHLHPAVLKLIYQTKGAQSIILVTDAMRAKGLPDGHYELGGLLVNKNKGTCRMASGVLAGSVLTMDQAVRNMVRFTGCSLAESVKMASLNPARLLGLDHRKGSIAVGKDADLVVLDPAGNIHMSVVKGQVAYRN